MEIVKTKSLGAVVRFFYLEQGTRPRGREREMEGGERGGGMHRPRRATRGPRACTPVPEE